MATHTNLAELPLSLGLPLPPSTNHVWKAFGKTRFLSAEYKNFKLEVARIWELAGKPHIEGRLALTIKLHFPDRRRCDISNRVKALEDSLKGLMFGDDEQIDLLTVARGEIRKPGCCIVTVCHVRGEG